MFKNIMFLFVSLGGLVCCGADNYNTVEEVVNEALGDFAQSYQPQAKKLLKDFILKSIKIPEDHPKVDNYSSDSPSYLNPPINFTTTGETVIVVDAGFSDAALTYRNDVVGIYDMDRSTGNLVAKSLDINIPVWAWEIYDLQIKAGIPLRILQAMARKNNDLGPFLYPSDNLIKNTSYVEELQKANGWQQFPADAIIYDSQDDEESKYHGAKVVYTLKEWAPEVKLILVRYDLKNTRWQNEKNMIVDLSKIALKHNAGFLVRSMSTQSHHWAGADGDLLKDILIINAAPDGKTSFDEQRINQLKPKDNFIFANTFSTGNTFNRIPKLGVTKKEFDNMRIGKFSFASGTLSENILDATSVFINRHLTIHSYNPESFNFDSGRNNGVNFCIGFKDPDDLKVPCSVRPYWLVGDSSSIAPVVAAWAIFLKKKSPNFTNGDIRNIITGKDARIFQDPIAHGEFTIFEQGYASGLIVPKLPKVWLET